MKPNARQAHVPVLNLASFCNTACTKKNCNTNFNKAKLESKIKSCHLPSGLFDARAAEYLESYPEPTGMNRILKGLGER